MTETAGLFDALAKAQGELKNPPKKSYNPHFRSHFADMTAGLETIRPALSKHGIAFTQSTFVEGDNLMLRTCLHHGLESFESVWPVCKIGAQATMAAAMTWSKRQSLFAIVGVHGDDDATDDTAPTAPDKAKAERDAYTAKAVKDVADIDSMDRVDMWWLSEKANRQLHFDNDAGHPQFKEIVAACAKRKAELEKDRP